MSTWNVQDETLSVELMQTGSALSLSMRDKRDGRCWGHVPLLELEAYSKTEFRADRTDRYRIDQVEAADAGLHVVIGHRDWGLRVGLWLSVADGELVVRMPIVEVYEDRSTLYRLLGVLVLPGLLAADADEQMLLPLNTGCLSSPRGKPALRDRFMIYGEQSRWELLPTLPVAAVHGGGGGLMALASSAAAEAECHVATNGEDQGEITFGLTLRQHWPDPVEWETRELRYRPIPAGDDLLQHVAERLRRHIQHDLGKPTLKARIDESPDLAYLLNSFTMKLFFGVENHGIMMAGQETTNPVTFQRKMTFAEAETGLRRLHDAGIEHIYTQAVGWNPSGHDGLYPTVWPIDERLGGERGFRQLIQAGRDLGYRMHVHDDRMMSVQRSPDHKVDELVHDMWGGPMGIGEWAGGTAFVPNTLLQSDEQLLGHFRKLRGLGLTGMGYLDYMGHPLYRNYHPRHRFGRSGYARMTNRLIDLAREAYGAAGTECGFLYCAAVADSVCTGGEEWHRKRCRPEWPITQLMDRIVPLYRMTLSGLVFHIHKCSKWHDVMHAVLFAHQPQDEWSAHPGVMPVLDDARIARLKAIYDCTVARLGHLQAEPITSWSGDGDVQQTTYADGTTIRADFGAERLYVNDEELTRPASLS